MAAEKEPKTEPAIPKGMKKRKDLPSVAYLLKHGDPETAHIPPTWAQIIGYPFVLAMIFVATRMIGLTFFPNNYIYNFVVGNVHPCVAILRTICIKTSDSIIFVFIPHVVAKAFGNIFSIQL